MYLRLQGKYLGTHTHTQDKACEGMELFDEIVECEVGMVTPHLPALIQFSLQVASNGLLGNNIRAKALSFLQWLASLKKKVISTVYVTCLIRPVPLLELVKAGAAPYHY